MKPIRSCTHIKVNGIVCGSPALREQKFCYFHFQQEERARIRRLVGMPLDPTIHIHSLEDPESVQLALQEIILATLDERIDHRKARVVLYALQIAQNNFKYLDRKPDTDQMSTDFPVEPLIKGRDYPGPASEDRRPEPPQPEEQPRKPVQSAAQPVSQPRPHHPAPMRNPIPTPTPLPDLHQIERDIASAKSGDLGAAKRLLAHLAKP